MAACWPLQMDVSAKAVLIALADNANDAGKCWPSLDTIARRTCLHRSNVIHAIERLEAMGHLSVDRATGRSSVYTITPNLDLFDRDQSRSATRRVSLPVAERYPSRSAQTSSGALPDQSRSATGPVAERDPNPKEPKRTVNKSNRQDAREKRALPDWLPDDLWRDWVEYRKGGKGRFTEKAEALSLRTLTKLRDAGHDPRRVIELAIERGWTGLFAPRDDAVSARGSPGKPPIAQQFTAKTYTGTADNELPLHLRA